MDWLPCFFAVAIKSLGMFYELMATRAVAEVKVQLVTDLRDILSAEWGASLALFIKDELCMSDADYSRLRIVLCKGYSATRERWGKLVWYRCDVTKKTVWLPARLISKHKWYSTWRGYVAQQGLSLSEDDTVCERSLLVAAASLIARCRPMLVNPPRADWYLTFGIDGTAISGKHKFTHAALSLGAMYKNQKDVLTELKAVTFAIRQHHDDATGLDVMLRCKNTYAGKEGGGAVTCLAEEINQVYASGMLRLGDNSMVKCDLRCCLDLVAAQGMHGSRGKSVCYCGC
eukprot:5262952-Pleurochrysis_carterae.AAC.4